MIKNKIVLLAMGVSFIAILCFFIFGTPSYRSMKVKSEGSSALETKLKKASSENSEIDISKLTNFDWDECYVFTPYCPSKEVYEKVGKEWTTAKTYIGFRLSHSKENETVNDDEFLMVFKKGSKVVLAEKYSISKLPVIFKLDNYKFTSSNANFLVADSKINNEGKIKELVLKN